MEQVIKRGRGRAKGSFLKIIPTHENGKPVIVYTKYHNMVRRCHSESSHNYKDYGGRGIVVCERWLGVEGFNNFIRDMGVPLPGMTLGRINNDLGYSPDNCRWETWKEQCANRRDSSPKRIKPNSIKQKALRSGLPYHVVYMRIKLLGWEESVALTVPKKAWNSKPHP